MTTNIEGIIVPAKDDLPYLSTAFRFGEHGQLTSQLSYDLIRSCPYLEGVVTWYCMYEAFKWSLAQQFPSHDTPTSNMLSSIQAATGLNAQPLFTHREKCMALTQKIVDFCSEAAIVLSHEGRAGAMLYKTVCDVYGIQNTKQLIQHAKSPTPKTIIKYLGEAMKLIYRRKRKDIVLLQEEAAALIKISEETLPLLHHTYILVAKTALFVSDIKEKKQAEEYISKSINSSHSSWEAQQCLYMYDLTLRAVELVRDYPYDGQLLFEILDSIIQNTDTSAQNNSPRMRLSKDRYGQLKKRAYSVLSLLLWGATAREIKPQRQL